MKQNQSAQITLSALLCASHVPTLMAQGTSPPAPNTAAAAAQANVAALTDATIPRASQKARDTSQSAAGSIDVIVVTAQRREQNLQDVPISISAVTAESLDSQGIDAVDELSGVSPGLTVTRQLSAVTPYIRGIGNPNSSGGQESAVALYVDGIYVPQMPALNFSFNSIKRIEVLKGPQGTLFGRNATGGLIQIVTQDPTRTPTLRGDFSYDEYQTTAGALYAGAGLAENLAADLAVVYSDQGKGYGDNLTTGNETHLSRELGLRSTWLLDAADATQVRLSVDYTDVDTSKGIARRANPTTRTIDGRNPPADFWDLVAGVDPYLQFQSSGAGLKIAHDFESMQFVSLSGYRKVESEFLNDQDTTPLKIVDTLVGDDNRMFSQELQLLSTGSGPLTWIAGLFYFDYDVDYTLDVTGSSVALAGGRSLTSTSFDTTSWAAYAQGTYEIVRDTKLTLGLRHTQDRREFDGVNTTANGTITPSTSPRRQSAGEPSWRVALDHRFTDDVLGFVAYNRGFKSGVYNTASISAKPVDSEKVDAYEIGVKSDWPRQRLRANASAFFYDYQNLQIQTPASGTQVLSNASAAQIYGAELEIAAWPLDVLELTWGMSWIDTRYTSYRNAQITTPRPPPTGGNAVSSGDVSGNELLRAPSVTGAFTARYVIPSPAGEFAISTSYVYTGDFYWEPDNRVRQDAYGLLNARISWSSPDDRYSAYVFGKNLTDEEYSMSFSGGALGDLISAQPPRTVGVGAQLRFE